MRKIEQKMIEAVKADRAGTFNVGGNTIVVKQDPNGWGALGEWTVYLHGHQIAKREDGKLYLRHAGYITATTRSRLAALACVTGVGVCINKGQMIGRGCVGPTKVVERAWTSFEG